MLKVKDLIKGIDKNPIGTFAGAVAFGHASRKLGAGWILTTSLALGGALAGSVIEERIKEKRV